MKLVDSEKSAQVVIASRRLPESQIVIPQGLVRESLGRVFTWISRWWLGVPVSDFTCGCKVFSRGAAREIFSRQQIHGWGFDAELLFLATKLKMKIHQIHDH